MTEESPELRQLKKQTEMMAHKQAGNAAGGGCLLAGLIVVALAFFAPGAIDWIAGVMGPGWFALLLMVGVPMLFYIAEYRRLTKD